MPPALFVATGAGGEVGAGTEVLPDGRIWDLVSEESCRT